MSKKLNASVLIVDGDQQNSQIIQAALTSQGYRTQTAEDIAAAIWTAANRENEFDLLVCDCFVDEQTGLEVYEAIKEIPACRDIPAMFMSRHQTADVILRRHGRQGIYHIKKPLDVELLVELADRSLWLPHLVNSHLEKHHQAQALAAPHAPFASVEYPSMINTNSFVTPG